jgi:hypothetical protein
MSAVWGPFSQARGTDIRWFVSYSGAQIILTPSPESPDTVMRSHDAGMYQPRLDRPNPYPDYFASIVVERTSYDVPQFYLVGNG